MRDPLFIVAPPRSYTSVVAGMIGQHPQAYGLPELNLSHADTLGDLWDTMAAVSDISKVARPQSLMDRILDARPSATGGPAPSRPEPTGSLADLVIGVTETTMAGLLRLLAQLHDGEQTEEAVLRARKWILRRPHWSIAQVFAHIQEALGPDRMLVEKSPRNTFTPENLRRLLDIFPRASFLHLTRHPRTHGKSALDLRKAHGQGNMMGDPETIWLRTQANILELSRGLATGQYMRIKGEMLLRDPDLYLRQICEWLDLDTDDDSIAAMLHPEDSPYAHVGPPSALYGNDPNFLARPTLDLERLKRIEEPPLLGDVEWKGGRGFTQPVLQMARQFGYA